MIFIDTKLPMHLVGANEVYKSTARRMLDRAATNGERLVTDAEVLSVAVRRTSQMSRALAT